MARRPLTPNSKPTVNRTPAGEMQVSISHEMENPAESFYADRLEVFDVPYGKRLLAVHENAFSGEADQAVELILDVGAYGLLLDQLNGLRDSFLAATTSGLMLPPMKGIPQIVGVYKALVAYTATSFYGISMDFYGLAAVDVHRVVLGVKNLPQLRPLVRIEMLPGRLNHLCQAPVA